MCVKGGADGLLSCKACQLIPVWTATACSRSRFSCYSGARSNSMVSSRGMQSLFWTFPLIIPAPPPPHTHTVRFLSTLELETELPRGGGRQRTPAGPLNMLPKKSKFPIKKQTKAASHCTFIHIMYFGIFPEDRGARMGG